MMTITVTSAVGPEHSFLYPRPRHSPELRSGTSQPSPSLPPTPAALPSRPLRSRSLSLSVPHSVGQSPTVDLPSFDFDLPSFDFDLGNDLDTSFSVGCPALKPNGHASGSHGTNSDAVTAPTDMKVGVSGPQPVKVERRKSLLSRSASWVLSSKSSADVQRVLEEDSAQLRQPRDVDTRARAASRQSSPGASGADDVVRSSRPSTTKGNSARRASFARRSWISSSSRPSSATSLIEAADVTVDDKTDDDSSVGFNKLRRKRPASIMAHMQGEGSKSTESLTRIGSYLSRIKPRPQSALVKSMVEHDPDSTSSSVASLAPPSTSTRPSKAASVNSNSTGPDDYAHFQTSNLPRLRDPLWSAFKTLESEYSRFQTRATPLKMNLVRSALIPFLKSYAYHPSNKKLHHEDLERRALILNKWWAGMLELLEGKAHQVIAGVDRPTLLEATTVIMMRPEWRQSTHTFTPLVDRKPEGEKQGSGESSQPSLSSTGSDYVAESAEHNVRNMFVSNLVTQMSIVVDKLSQRHAPLSLVNFAGKACAYAFFFVPGIADVLVRLWQPTSELIRRVADEFHLPRHSKAQSDEIVRLFPQHLDALGWSSVKGMMSTLRQPTKLPLATARIYWHGPWTSRWRGRDTDLFFIFCKYYFLLAEEFFPPDIALSKKGTAPAFVLVNAQILAALDSTVHRKATVEAMMGPPLADFVLGADASAMMLGGPDNNVLKDINDNLLLALLKDFLGVNSLHLASARHTFAESFMALMKASAKRTSPWDVDACFTLCDFLEVSLVAYNGYVDVTRPTLEYIDWPFWLEVCKRMLESIATMSEVRVLSLIFSIWEAVTSDPVRKERLCLDLLLTETNFDRLFNNWSPMVRAYYMRLLCWRICRDDGSANESDMIFRAVSSRLKTVWSHYLWLKQTTEGEGKVTPSTAPSYPTPGKRFYILRAEKPPVEQPGLMMGFDSFSTTLAMPSHSVPDQGPLTQSEGPDKDSSTNKRRWTLFGKVLFSGSQGEGQRGETPSAPKPVTPPKQLNVFGSSLASDSDSMASSPTYESVQYVFKFVLGWNPTNAMPPEMRILTRPCLPAQAQSCLSGTGGSGSPALPSSGRASSTRAISGSSLSGLVAAARNAPATEPLEGLDRTPSTYESFDLVFESDSDEHQDTSDQEASVLLTPTSEPIIRATRPTGPWTTGVKYSGRSLAEWALVVSECNNFTDRRRDEGVAGLSQVEIPELGVDGLRKSKDERCLNL